MAVFHANEFLVNLPDALKDKTINMFTLTDEGPSELSVVVSRDRYKSDDLEAYIERQVAGLLPRMPLFKVVKREKMTVDKHPAVLLDCTWQSPQGKLFQRQVSLYYKPTSHMLLITASCKDPWKPKYESLFNEFLSNFRVRS